MATGRVNIAGGGIKVNGAIDVNEIVAQDVLKGDVVAAIFDTMEDAVKTDNPATLPASAGRSCAFSPDGVYLSVTHGTAPFITIYKRSGDVFTKLTNPSTLPTSTGYGCAFSPDGVYLSVGHDTTPFITIYKRSGDVFTKLTNPATLPPDLSLIHI